MPRESKLLEPLEPKESDLEFRASITEAENSGGATQIAQAKYGYGRWLMSNSQRRYGEAVPLFREVAEIYTSQNKKAEAAHAYHRLGNCLFFIGDVACLKEAEEAAKKAIDFYPDSEDFAEQRKTAIINHIAILASLFHQTGIEDYFNQGVAVCKQYADSLKSRGIQEALQLTGFTEAA